MNKLTKIKVAVTGGSGHIGHRVVDQLIERGHSVINIDKRPPVKPSPAKFVYVDTKRREQVQPVLAKVDAVIHLGEIPGVNNTYSEDELLINNTMAGATMFQAACDLKLQRMVYISTAQVYGCWGTNCTTPVSGTMDETHPLRARNTYALSKINNEAYGKYIADRYGLSVATLRFPAVHNWFKQRLDEACDWVKQQTGPIPEGWHTYVDADDAAHACVLLLENPRPEYQAYHCMADDINSGIPLAERIEKFSPEYPRLPKDWPPYKCPVLTDKLREHVGWKPTFNLIEEYRKKFGKYPHE